MLLSLYQIYQISLFKCPCLISCSFSNKLAGFFLPTINEPLMACVKNERKYLRCRFAALNMLLKFKKLSVTKRLDKFLRFLSQQLANQAEFTILCDPN